MQIPDEELSNIQTVNDIVNYIERHKPLWPSGALLTIGGDRMDKCAWLKDIAPALLRKRFTHSSTGEEIHNQRLEFLEMVLSLIISDWLYSHPEGFSEGRMSQISRRGPGRIPGNNRPQAGTGQHPPPGRGESPGAQSIFAGRCPGSGYSSLSVCSSDRSGRWSWNCLRTSWPRPARRFYHRLQV